MILWDVMRYSKYGILNKLNQVDADGRSLSCVRLLQRIRRHYLFFILKSLINVGKPEKRMVWIILCLKMKLMKIHLENFFQISRKEKQKLLSNQNQFQRNKEMLLKLLEKHSMILSWMNQRFVRYYRGSLIKVICLVNHVIVTHFLRICQREIHWFWHFVWVRHHFPTFLYSSELSLMCANLWPNWTL